MARTGLSRPVQHALEDDVLRSDRSFFDYGCGRSGDVQRLLQRGVAADGWDPVHHPAGEIAPADVVNLGYVVNVIEDRRERAAAVEAAWKLARSVLIVAARPDWEASQVRGHPRGDGIVTSKGTFQKFFGQDELRLWLESITGNVPVAAAPGIFYLFRDSAEAAGIRARRFRARAPGLPRIRRADLLWEEHQELLGPLAGYWSERGRLPGPNELAEGEQLVSTFGSLRAAAGVVRRVLGDDRFLQAQNAARDDLLVFLALEAFRGRPRLSELPDDIVLDVRAHFGTYKAACGAADEELFSLADEAKLGKALATIPFGKVLPDAVYVHADYVPQLPTLVRMYEGAASALVGSVDDVTLVKLSRVERRVSYLSYPRFEKDAHPELATSLRADLRSFHVRWRDYRDSVNPPILHRKETFVPEDYPGRAKFAALTRSEERAGLLDNAVYIGTLTRWRERLADRGLDVRGHRLVRQPAPDTPRVD